MIRQPSMQRIVQLLRRRLDPGVGQRRQSARIAYARNHRLDYPPPAGAHDIGQHRVQFDVGLCERLLIRWTCRVCSRPSCLRVRSSERSSCTSSSGTKLGLIKPQAKRSAIHIASFKSVLRPGTFLMCAALATIRRSLLRQNLPHRHPIDPGSLHRTWRSDIPPATPTSPQAVRRRVKGPGY